MNSDEIIVLIITTITESWILLSRLVFIPKILECISLSTHVAQQNKLTRFILNIEVIPYLLKTVPACLDWSLFRSPRNFPGRRHQGVSKRLDLCEPEKFHRKHIHFDAMKKWWSNYYPSLSIHEFCSSIQNVKKYTDLIIPIDARKHLTAQCVETQS